jgi:hypothetical protein
MSWRRPRYLLRRKGGAMGTFWAIVTIAVVVGLVVLASFVFVVEPFRHHPQH